MGRYSSIALLISVSSMGLAPHANAGPYEDAFAKCLVASSSTRDNIVLVKWIARLILEHPELKHLSQIADADRTKIDKDLAAFFVRVLTVDCVKEGKQATKYEGSDIYTSAFGYLGEYAMKNMMQNKNVSGAAENFTKYLDQEALKKTMTPE